MSTRTLWLALALACLSTLIWGAYYAPEFLSPPNLDARSLGPLEAPPFGTDDMGIPYLEYVLQGAKIVTMPAVISGFIVMVLSMAAGVSRCAAIGWVDVALQGSTEIVGALPRLVVVLVVAVGIPAEWRGMLPIAIVWAILSAPGAMDEAASSAGRLGGAQFVEALRAHGFSATRVYLYHVLWMNLKSVIVRQAAEVAMQVVFLEIALSYLAAATQQPSFTHADSLHSWAALLYDGFTQLVYAWTGSWEEILSLSSYRVLGLGVFLVALVALMASAFRLSVRPR